MGTNILIFNQLFHANKTKTRVFVELVTDMFTKTCSKPYIKQRCSTYYILHQTIIRIYFIPDYIHYGGVC